MLCRDHRNDPEMQSTFCSQPMSEEDAPVTRKALPSYQYVTDTDMFEWSYDVNKSADDNFMILATVMSRKSDSHRGHMGTVVVRDQQILMCTTNAELYGHSARREIHAEARAIAQCGRFGISTTGATIYITMPPCVDCFLVIVASGITRCVYRGRQREECVTRLAEHNMIEMVDGFDLPNSAAWQTEATLVWDRYFAKYPEKMPARIVERRRKAAELQHTVNEVDDAHQSS